MATFEFYSSQVDDKTIACQAIPSCLVPKDLSERRHQRCTESKNIVESIIRSVCDTLYNTGGVTGSLPQPLMHVFNNLACRGNAFIFNFSNHRK